MKKVWDGICYNCNYTTEKPYIAGKDSVPEKAGKGYSTCPQCGGVIDWIVQEKPDLLKTTSTSLKDKGENLK